MNRRGVDFSLVQVEPTVWRWHFQIGGIVTTGTTEARLLGIAVHRVKQRIDEELDVRRSPEPFALTSV